VAIIGADIAEALFPFGSPLGKEVKIRGLKFIVIGVMKREGESLLGMPSSDNTCFIPYKGFQKLYYTGGMFGINSRIAIKGFEEDKELLNLENELTGFMIVKRALKPLEEENFVLNKHESIANFLTEIFNVITFARWLIDGFSLLVGMFRI